MTGLVNNSEEEEILYARAQEHFEEVERELKTTPVRPDYFWGAACRLIYVEEAK